MEHFAELMKQAHEGDKSARDALVSENLGLVHAVARRFEHRGGDREELFQIGCIGLIKAIDKFDLSLNLAFSTYAVPLITGEIRRYLRDDGMIRVSRTLKENAYKVQRAREELCSELNREPTLLELSEKTELSTEEIVMAGEANREVESIYQPIYEKDGDELLLVDQISAGNRADGARDEPEKEALLNQMLIGQLLAELDEKESTLIRLRYYEEMTQREIAETLSMTQVQVCRMEKKILLRFREMLRKPC